MKNKNKGFTLVEILVVIAIIAVLAAMLVVVAGNILVASQVKGTTGTILTLVTGCEQYRSLFFLYPDVNPPNFDLPDYPGSTTQVSLAAGGTITQDNFKEWNKRLRYMLLEYVYLVDEVEYGPFIQQELPFVKDENDPDNNNNDMFADAWGEFLRICPPRDHSTVDNIPAGPNNLAPGSLLDAKRATYISDIYSIGPEGVDDTDRDFTTTQYKADEHDDVVHWFIEKQ